MSDLIQQDPRNLPVPHNGQLPDRPGEEYFYQEEEDLFDLRRYLQILRKHKWVIMACLVTGGLLGYLETSLTTPLYLSSTTIQIDPPSNILPYAEIQAVDERLQFDTTQLKILESHSLARRVIRSMNLEEDPRFDPAIDTGFVKKIPALFGYAKKTISSWFPKQKDASDLAALSKVEKNNLAVAHLIDNLSVGVERTTRIVRAGYSSYDPEFAALVVNTLAEEYIELNFESKFEATTKATDFLERQLRDLKIEIEKAEENLVQYTRDSQYIDFSNESDITLQKLGSLTEELTRVETEMISLRASYESVKTSTPERFPYSLRNDTIDSLEQIRFGLEQRLASLSAQFGPNWPEVVQVKQELEQVAIQLQEERGLAIQLARTDYETARKRYRLLKATLNQERNLATDLHEASIQYSILKREVDSSKQLYEGLLQRMKEAGVSAGLKSSNIRVVDPGEAPRWAYHPRIQYNLVLGLLLGLVCGVGLAYLFDQMDNTVNTPDDVERALALPSLGMVPAFVPTKGRGGRMLLLRKKRNDQSQRHVLWNEKDTRSRMWEAYRGLSMSILLSHSDHAPQVVLVTSAFPKEGKSTTAINTAVVLAHTGARTLLVDLDLRKPALAHTFGLNKDQGMSKFLSGNSDFSSELVQTPVPNLVIAPSGPIPPSPAVLLSSERMEKALGLMREFFKYIVIDTPPVLSVTDPLMLTRHSDGLILVVKGGATPREAVRKASQQINRFGGNILGAVINGINLRKAGYGSYYGYYNYYQDYYAEGETVDRSL